MKQGGLLGKVKAANCDEESKRSGGSNETKRKWREHMLDTGEWKKKRKVKGEMG